MLNVEEQYMNMALQLARQGEGWTSPNPMVGAVLVNEDGVVATGYHRYPGGTHAEVEALNQAGDKAKGSTLYVNLEPCCHFGKTSPCTEALIRAGVAEVVIALVDPNPRVAGKGMERLQEAGINVRTGILEKEARRLNEAFIKFITTGLPFVTLKTATTLDGKVATCRGDTRWITGEASREEVHRLRHRVDGIVTGIHTVLQDDPSLNTRIEGGRDAARIIVDTRARLPLDARVVKLSSEAPTLLAAGENASLENKKILERKGVEVITLPQEGGMVSLSSLLEELGKRNMISLMVESGGTLNYSFLEKGLVDKIYAFMAPVICGGEQAPTSFEGKGATLLREAWRLKEVETEPFGEDLLVTGYL